MMKRIIFIVLIAITSTAQAQKFSALTPLSGGLATTDLMVVAEDIGGPPYQTRSFTGTDLVNFMNANISGGGIYSGSGALSGTTEVTQGANKLEFTVSVLDGFSVAGNTFSVDGANSRVGIGTTAPTETLDVVGTMAVSDDSDFDSGTLQIDAGTNFVGLGTTKTSVFSLEYRASAATDGMFIRNAAGNSRVVLGYDPNGSRLFMYNNSNVADFGYISNKVGLGFDISNPALILAKLHVQGDDDLAGTLGLLVENNSAADNFKVQNDGVCVFRSFTVATLPSASTAGGFIFVSDETGGAVMAFSDGTNWRRVTDRAIVS